MSGLDKSSKTRYQPIFRHCLGAVLQSLVKEETWTFRRMNAPTVGPGMKSTGSYSMLKVRHNWAGNLTPNSDQPVMAITFSSMFYQYFLRHNQSHLDGI